ncbi:Ferredoxin-dependent glutamate synthase [hydrothermal vent metagenome]|uniref:Ferredoxin-dependent glutamate synthase n=1 Tax=hydrothermal vent metagenome TaxID=652676 RepID=A0A3B1A514_9ZZZZ
MFESEFSKFLTASLNLMSTIFVFLVGLAVLAVIVLFILDIIQSKHAIRRNYPVIGRFRYLFETLGEFFRQYFFAMDREELPFNRSQRNWAYRAAKNINNHSAFGSTRDLRPTGTILFVNCPFPTLEVDAASTRTVTIGAQCLKPYKTSKLFHISGMSFGALSRPAVRALSMGAAKAGCWMNTGEGGLSPYHLEGGADLVFQIGTAKYGVRDSEGRLDDEKLKEIANHEQIKMFEIKLSQGAKPGKGGILPAIKVTDEIAKIRGIKPRQSSISPNRHTDINSVDELLDMIIRIRKVTGKPVGFKSVIGAYGWLDTFCEAVNKRGLESAPDFVTVDSADGGSGAAPVSLMDAVGLPINESLPRVVDALTRHGLRDHVKVICSGKLVTPTAVAWALCMGADFITSARGFMFSLGCIQAMQCHKDTCPTGITTHNPRLQKGLNSKHKAVRVMHYQENMEHEVGIIAHSCGVAEPRQLKRFHARIVTDTGLSIGLDELHPEPELQKN